MIDKIKIGNIPVHLFTVQTLHNEIEQVILNNNKRVFLHANARLIELANTSEKWLIDFFNQTENYVMCDGSGIQLAAKLTKQSVPEKIPYNIWIWDLVKFLSLNRFSLFFLGSDIDTVQSALNKIEKIEPGIKIAGFHHGYFDKRKDGSENIAVINAINEKRPDILLVGFGMPMQEHWIKENLGSLNVKGIFTCGGAFDFISGNRPVAPKIFRILYLEWLFRFSLEPRRLFRRAFVSNFEFIKILFRELLKREHIKFD